MPLLYHVSLLAPDALDIMRSHLPGPALTGSWHVPNTRQALQTQLTWTCDFLLHLWGLAGNFQKSELSLCISLSLRTALSTGPVAVPIYFSMVPGLWIVFHSCGSNIMCVGRLIDKVDLEGTGGTKCGGHVCLTLYCMLSVAMTNCHRLRNRHPKNWRQQAIDLDQAILKEVKEEFWKTDLPFWSRFMSSVIFKFGPLPPLPKNLLNRFLAFTKSQNFRGPVVCPQENWQKSQS